MRHRPPHEDHLRDVIVCCVLFLLLALSGGCEEPASCRELKAQLCDLCGDDAPLCARIKDKTDSEEQCSAMLRITKRTFSDLEARPEAERKQKLEQMCQATQAKAQ